MVRPPGSPVSLRLEEGLVRRDLPGCADQSGGGVRRPDVRRGPQRVEALRKLPTIVPQAQAESRLQ